MRVREDKAGKLIAFLNNIYKVLTRAQVTAPSPPDLHEQVVQIIYELGDTLLRLKHAYDRWRSQLFLVSTEDQLNEAKTKYLVGALHELAETGALTLLKIDEIKEFYNFKSQYEWLERRFGLRPSKIFH
jgi:hypothetical protein